TCSYHGWTYRNDGALVGVPFLKEAYYGALERERWGLIPVAQLDSYKGLLFATFDREAPPLREYLGEMTWYLDAFFDRREGGIEVVGGMHKWVMPCNWKFPAENFGRRRSRGARPHPPTDKTLLWRGGDGDPGRHWEHGAPRPRSRPDLRRAERRGRPACPRNPGLRAGDRPGGAQASRAPLR